MNNTKNQEGYMDTTAHQAIKRMERAERPAFRPLVYICAPFSGDREANVNQAIAFAKHVYDSGNIPLTPHLLFPFMDDTNPEERKLALFMDIVLMRKCQEVWVFGDTITAGMKVEIEKAETRRQRMRYFNNDFREVE